MGTVPRAKDLILQFIEQGMEDPTFAPVHLTAQIEAVDAKAVQTDIVRSGESLWHGQLYDGTMLGTPGTYPSIDLSLFPWSKQGGLDDITFESMRDGRVLAAMQTQLDCALTTLPFQLRPKVKSIESLRAMFAEDNILNRQFTLELFREDVPDWITGLDQLHMTGSWKVFIPQPSPEWNLLRQVFARKRVEDELAQLQTISPEVIAAKAAELRSLDAAIAGSTHDMVM